MNSCVTWFGLTNHAKLRIKEEVSLLIFGGAILQLHREQSHFQALAAKL